MLAAMVTSRWSTAMLTMRRTASVSGRMHIEKISSGKHERHQSHQSGPARCFK